VAGPVWGCAISAHCGRVTHPMWLLRWHPCGNQCAETGFVSGASGLTWSWLVFNLSFPKGYICGAAPPADSQDVLRQGHQMDCFIRVAPVSSVQKQHSLAVCTYCCCADTPPCVKASQLGRCLSASPSDNASSERLLRVSVAGGVTGGVSLRRPEAQSEEG
jgi:hypothetical protein